MADTTDPKAMEETAKAVAALKAAATDTTRVFQEQLKIVTQMRDVMAQMAGTMKDVGDKGSNMIDPKVLDEAAKKLDQVRHVTTLTQKESKGLLDLFKNPFVKAAGMATAAIGGLFSIFKSVVGITKGVLSFIGGVVNGFMSVGRSILSIPFKMMDVLFNMASRGGDNALAAALEDVREEFGSLKSESSQTIINVAKNMDKMNETGVNAYRVYGNLAERVKAVTALAKGMGATFSVFQDEIMKNGVAIMNYQRGLGITDEQMEKIGYQAMRMGKDIATVQNEMTKQALGMSKAFGLNAKVLSKDMAKAMADLAHFGHLSSKEMGVTAAFAQKMGVSIDKLTATMDATKTFDQTVEGVSKLNEQFNLNIDATELMTAENPAQQVAILQKAFQAAGRDVSTMNRFEKELIKSTGFMGDELLNASLSAKGMSVDFAAMQRQGDKNEKKTLTQADAMKELADSIKRLTPSGDMGKGGILDRFLQGISHGIERSPEFIRLMENIRQVFRDAFWAGHKLGRMFVDLFPGVKDVFQGLSELFDPARFRKMFDGVLKAFDVFKTGGTGKMEDFMENLHKVFFDFFDAGKGPGKKIMNGFSQFGQVLFGIVKGIAAWTWEKLKSLYRDFIKEIEDPGPTTRAMMNAVTKGAQDLAGWIKTAFVPFTKDAIIAFTEWLKPASLKGLSAAVPDMSEMKKFAIDVFTPLGGALRDAWVELKEPLKELGKTIIKKLLEMLEWAWDQVPDSVKFKFMVAKWGPALVQSLFGPLTLGLVKAGLLAFFPKLAAMMGIEAAAAGATAGTAGGTAFLTSLGTTITGGFAAVTAGITALGGALVVGTVGIVGGAFGVAFGAGIDAIISDRFDSANKKAQEEAKKIEDSNSKLYDLTAAERKKKLEEQLAAQQKVVEENTGWWTEHMDMLYGKGNAKLNAQLAADASKAMLNEFDEAYQKRVKEEEAKGQAKIAAVQEEQRKKALKEAQDRNLKMVGDITFDNAEEKFKKIEELSKKVMGTDFNLKAKMEDIRKKLSDVDFNLMDSTKEEQLLRATDQMQRVQSIFKNTSEIAGYIDSTKVALEKVDKDKIFSGYDKLEPIITKALNTVSNQDQEKVKLSPDRSRDISSMFSSISEIVNNLSKFDDKMQKVAPALPLMYSSSGKTGYLSHLQQVITAALIAVNYHDPTLIAAGPDRAAKIGEMFDKMSIMTGSITAYAESNSKLSTSVLNTGIQKSLLAVSDMVAAVQQMDTALSQIKAIDLTAKLGSVANAVGLGSSKVYTVNGKEVAVTINLTVTMDAGEVEKVIIGRKESVIRDRINFILDGAMSKDPQAAAAAVKPRPEANVDTSFGSKAAGSA